MSQWLKQSTAATVKLGPFVDDTDFKTAETGLTIAQADIRLSKNGGAFAQTNNAAGATHDEAGEYGIPLDTTDTGTLGRLRVRVSKSGALPAWMDFMVLPAGVFDTLITNSGGALVAGITGNITGNLSGSVGSVTGAVGSVTGAVGSVTGAVGSVTGLTNATIADAVWDEAIAGHLGAGSTGEALDNAGAGGSPPSAATIADAVWDEVITGNQHNVNNSAAKFLRTAAGGTQVTIHSGTAQSGSTANTIKLDTGASSANDIYNRSLVVITGGTGVGQTRRIVDYVGSTRVATVDQAWTVTPDNTSTFDIIAAPVSVISDEGVAQAGGASTITLATTASTADDIYVNALVTITSGTGAGQTRQITNYVGSTRVATVDAVWGVNPDNTSVYAVIPAGDATTGGETGGPTAAEIADFVWDELVVDHTISGSTGEAIGAAGGAGDPWITLLPGAYGAGTAGQIIGDMLAETEAAITAYGALKPTVPLRTLDVTASGTAGIDWGNVENPSTTVDLENTTISEDQIIATVTGNVNGSVGSVVSLTITSLDAATLAAIADAILKRDFGLISGEASRSLLNAVRFLRNKWDVTAGVLTVTKEDDATTAWSAATTGTAGADPITAVDPT